MKMFLLVSIVVILGYEFVVPSEFNVCGWWSPFGPDKNPTCRCLGKIVLTGGPTGPADDSGGNYRCMGLYFPKFSFEKDQDGGL